MTNATACKTKADCPHMGCDFVDCDNGVCVCNSSNYQFVRPQMYEGQRS